VWFNEVREMLKVEEFRICAHFIKDFNPLNILYEKLLAIYLFINNSVKECVFPKYCKFESSLLKLSK